MAVMMVSSSTGLPKDWAYSPSFDLELKQYVLLGYLQRVQARFKERKLFPYLSDLYTQTEELLHLQRSKVAFTRDLHGPLLGFDRSTGQAKHAKPEDPEPLRVVDDVIDFALPKLQRFLATGNDLRKTIAQRLRLTPIGLVPLYTAEGWLLLRWGSEAHAYTYTIPMVVGEQGADDHRKVFTRYVATYPIGLSSTYEGIKSGLIRSFPHMPNPATFAVESEVDAPRIETLLPLAKCLVLDQARSATDVAPS